MKVTESKSYSIVCLFVASIICFEWLLKHRFIQIDIFNQQNICSLFLLIETFFFFLSLDSPEAHLLIYEAFCRTP